MFHILAALWKIVDTESGPVLQNKKFGMNWQYGSTEYTLSTYPQKNEEYGLIVFTSGQVLGLSDADNFSINAPVSIVDPNHISEGTYSLISIISTVR